MNISLTPVPKNLFFSKNDPQDPRLGEKTSAMSLQSMNEDTSIAIWGYPDDRGITMNGGRAGASSAPNQIREFFYKMTPPLGFSQKNIQIAELGNLELSKDLAQDHEKAKLLAQTCTEKNIPWCSLGGGHDWGYPDGAGFLSATKNISPLVINFDAHFDVRPMGPKGPHSGTPFFRLLEEFSFEFIEVGIQPQCNSDSHWSYLKNKNARIVFSEEIQEKGLLASLQKTLSANKQRPVFLSIDIDAFSVMEAPGASQSWPTGFHTVEFMKTLKWLVQNFTVKGIGLYEVSPPLDVAHMTSKLASLIMHEFLKNKLSEKI